MLADEVRRGGVDYCGSSRRYVLNGGLTDDVKLAMSDLFGSRKVDMYCVGIELTGR